MEYSRDNGKSVGGNLFLPICINSFKISDEGVLYKTPITQRKLAWHEIYDVSDDTGSIKIEANDGSLLKLTWINFPGKHRVTISELLKQRRQDMRLAPIMVRKW